MDSDQFINYDACSPTSLSLFLEMSTSTPFKTFSWKMPSISNAVRSNDWTREMFLSVSQSGTLLRRLWNVLVRVSLVRASLQNGIDGQTGMLTSDSLAVRLTSKQETTDVNDQ